MASRHDTRFERSRLKKIAPGVGVTRVRLSVGVVELFRFDRYAHAFPRHAHERFTFGVFGPDNGRIRARGAEWPAAENSILALAPDESHSAEPLRGRGWTYRSLYPSAEVVAAALGAGPSGLPRFDRPVIHDPLLARKIERLHCRLERQPDAALLEEQLLMLIRRLAARHGSGWMETRDLSANRVVPRARAYLEAHAAEPVRLLELAAHCGVSPFRLIRSFHRELGMPPHAWLTQLRANRARALLQNGEPPTSVAYQCGFSDQSHLTRIFRGIFGMTPGAYVQGRSATSRRP